LAIGPTNVVALRRRCDLRSVFTGRCPPRAGIDARAGYRRVVDHAIGWPWRDTAFDAAAVVAAAAISAFMVLGSRPILEPLGGAMIAGQVGLALCLLFRRRAPLALAWAATAAAAAIAIVELAAPGSIVPANLSPDDIPWLPAAAPFAAYSAMAYARDRRAAWLPVVALTVIGTHRWNAPPNSPWLLQSLLFIGGPALLGRTSPRVDASSGRSPTAPNEQNANNTYSPSGRGPTNGHDSPLRCTTSSPTGSA